MAAGVLVAAMPHVAAGEPPLLDRSICAEAALHDCRLTIHARRLLYADVLLGPLNLGVSVRQHVATVWGPVPSTDLARRAVELLRQVPGVAEVESRVVVESANDPLVEFLKAPRGVPPPAALASRDESGSEPTPGRQAGRRSDVVAFLPIIPLPPRAAPSVPQTPPAGAADLPRSVERLRQGDRRFQHLQPHVLGRVVCLRGFVARWEDVHELARAISLLPGVERVLLEDVRVSSGSSQAGNSQKPY